MINEFNLCIIVVILRNDLYLYVQNTETTRCVTL